MCAVQRCAGDARFAGLALRRLRTRTFTWTHSAFSIAWMEFRLFLLRHAGLLRFPHRWTIRVLMPAPFASAIRLFGHAARETLAIPLPPSNAEVLPSVFRERQRRRHASAEPTDPSLRARTWGLYVMADEPSDGEILAGLAGKFRRGMPSGVRL